MHDPPELLAHRLGHLLRDRLHALHERVAGPERAGEELQHVGELRLELLLAPLGQEVEDGRREQRHQDRARSPTKKPLEDEQHDAEHGHPGDVDEDRLGRAEREVGLLEPLLDLLEEALALGEVLGDLDGPLEQRGLREARLVLVLLGLPAVGVRVEGVVEDRLVLGHQRCDGVDPEGHRQEDPADTRGSSRSRC